MTVRWVPSRHPLSLPLLDLSFSLCPDLSHPLTGVNGTPFVVDTSRCSLLLVTCCRHLPPLPVVVCTPLNPESRMTDTGESSKTLVSAAKLVGGVPEKKKATAGVGNFLEEEFLQDLKSEKQEFKKKPLVAAVLIPQKKTTTELEIMHFDEEGVYENLNRKEGFRGPGKVKRPPGRRSMDLNNKKDTLSRLAGGKKNDGTSSFENTHFGVSAMVAEIC